ncbi:alpha/beta hydrolase [Clostridium sp.]|uniref:alpha/beta fold hydrolase n=1 Tax=Clostridium sp. TaxID=1506 RepID=UPI0025C6654F|nr:alpha/beta hydrolase [Clostridium sp.]
MKYFVKTSDNARIAVEDLNSEAEKTILFIHGWPLNHTVYEYQLNYFPDKGYRCVAIDLRGFGDSDRPYNGYDYDTMAADIKKVIDVLKLNNITLVGHSMGGALSIRYLSNYNGHGVSKLCLIGAAAPSWVKTRDWPYGYTEEEVTNFINDSLKDRPRFISNVSDLFFYQYISQALLSWFTNIALSASPWATTQCLISLKNERLFNDIPKIKIPTLILHGTHDKVCPYDFAKYLDENIEDSTLVPLTESGHAAFIDEKDKVNNNIFEFIKNI